MSRPPTVIDPDDDDDGEEGEDLKHWTEHLTPEERARLTAGAQEAIKRISAAMVPEIDFSGIVKAESVLSAAMRNIQLPSQSSFESAVDAHRLWQRQTLAINSDALKGITRAQEQMRLLTASLTKNIDFGLGKVSEDLARSFMAQQTVLWKRLEPALRQIKRAYYPPNLRDIEDPGLKQVRAVVILDGIALYGVPRTSIARSLLRADTAAKRRAILGKKRREISADCRAVVGGVTSERFLPYARMLAVSLDALDSGQFAASQALTSNVLDALIFERWGKRRQKDWSKFLPDSNGKRADGVELAFHDYLATAPLKQAFQHFDRADKQSTPRDTYSRHATAHTVSGWQYSRRNAVQAAMGAASLLLFLEEREQVSITGPGRNRTQSSLSA
jgi:hypothetical protein